MADYAEDIKILYDSREQIPWEFEPPARRVTLPTGDYTVQGFTDLIVVERKTLADFVSCCTAGRDRFERELQRLRAYRFNIVIVECEAQDIWEQRYRSKAHPRSVIGSMMGWTARYGVNFQLAGDTASARWMALSFMKSAVRTVHRACPICRKQNVSSSESFSSRESFRKLAI